MAALFPALRRGTPKEMKAPKRMINASSAVLAQAGRRMKFWSRMFSMTFAITSTAGSRGERGVTFCSPSPVRVTPSSTILSWKVSSCIRPLRTSTKE